MESRRSVIAHGRRWLLAIALSVCSLSGLKLILGKHTDVRFSVGGTSERPQAEPAVGAFSSVLVDRALDSAIAELLACTDAAERNRKLHRLLETLAESDPDLALDFVYGETNPDIRRALTLTALRGWGGANPQAAGDWALRRPAGERVRCVGAVLEGASHHAPSAIAIATRAIATDPEFAYEYGSLALAALASYGNFAAAAEFAQKGAEEHRLSWLLDIFERWTDQDPGNAFDAAGAITDRDARESMLRQVLGQWASIEPAMAVKHAAQLPDAKDRRIALTTTLGRWVRWDVVSASAWINQYEAFDEVDEGVAAVAMSPALASQKPHVALEWARSLVDPQLRLQTISKVVEAWALRDRVAALDYLSDSADLSPADRKVLRDSLIQRASG